MADIHVIIGKNFGDEGKGLATDLICGKYDKCVVIKHNGGAQAGHTVHYNGRSFVFHQFSSGSFRGADTLFADTYYPDLYKLSDEAEAFSALSGHVPRIFCMPDTPAVYFGDVLTNRLLENSRGDQRHGSCGMGINEADLRSKAGYRITVFDFLFKTEKELFDQLNDIRKNYTLKRLCELGVGAGEYEDLFYSDEPIYGAVSVMKQNALKYVRPVFDTKSFLSEYSGVVFENGQGLLLDSEYKKYAPHLTASRTGLYNPAKFTEKYGLKITGVTYVSRTYVTRHGNGPLPYELNRGKYGLPEDETNHTNEWQGEFRYGAHCDFITPVKEDLSLLSYPVNASLLLTHINETDGKIVTPNGLCKIDDYLNTIDARSVFSGVYASGGKEADSVIRF
jgi:adenylosuccinate synthase